MAQGFYELLGVEAEASPDEIRGAYQRRLAELVRRLRVARQQGADVSILESQERAVQEAMEVLGDPARRRRYDSFREAMQQGELPPDAEKLWEVARGGMVDPVAGVALSVVRTLTRLPVGDPLPQPPPGYSRLRARRLEAPPEPAPAPVPAPAAQVEEPPAPPAPVVPPPAAPPLPEPELVATDPRLDFDLPSPEIDILPERGQPAQAPQRRGLLGALAALADGVNSLAGGASKAPPAPPVPSLADDDDWLQELDPPSRGPDLDRRPPGAESGDPIDRLASRQGMDGAFLRGVRELKGMSLDDLARATRISARYLAAIEENDFDRLPSATFVRGYLRQVAQVLEIADRGVVDGYMALYARHRG